MPAGRSDVWVRPIRDLIDTDKRASGSQTAVHEHTTDRRSVSGLRPDPDRSVVMAVSKSMQELHRVALELARMSHDVERARRVTVQMAETPWTRDPRRHGRDRPITGGGQREELSSAELSSSPGRQ
jgi:hypothetical protein